MNQSDVGDYQDADGTVIIATEFTPLTYFDETIKSGMKGTRIIVPRYIYDYRTFDIKIPDSAYNKGGLQGVA